MGSVLRVHRGPARRRMAQELRGRDGPLRGHFLRGARTDRKRVEMPTHRRGRALYRRAARQLRHLPAPVDCPIQQGDLRYSLRRGDCLYPCGFANRLAKEEPMAKGYWIVRVDIADPEEYKKYLAANAAPFRKHGARFLVRGAPFENVEGGARARNAVIEFPSYQVALDCYRSPEYQAAIKLRQPVSTADIVIIEGYEGAQP